MAAMKDIVILGAGGLAKDVAFLIEGINLISPTWNLLGFVEQDGAEVGRQVGKYPVVCTESRLADLGAAAAIGVGDPALVGKIAERFGNSREIEFPNLIHPSVVMDHEAASLGKGNLICAGNILVSDIAMGSFNLLNYSCILSHDVVLGNRNVISPGAHIMGGAVIGSGCLIGTGATILQYKLVGDGATVGARALVVRDVPENETVVGLPAKPMAKKPVPGAILDDSGHVR